MLRTRLTVDAPARWDSSLRPATWRRAERWTVEVRQEPLAVGWTYTVRARLVHEVSPQGPRAIPGVRVPAEGPRRFRSLSQARKDARRLASVLSGQLYPTWHEERLPPPH